MTEVEDMRPRGLRRLSPIELGMGELGQEAAVPSSAMALEGLPASLSQVLGRDPSLANVTEGLASAGLPGGGSGMIPPTPPHKLGSSGVISGAESAVSGLVQTGGPDDDADLIGFSTPDYTEPKKSKQVSYGIEADEANVYNDDDEEEETETVISRKRTSFRTDEDEDAVTPVGVEAEEEEEDEEWAEAEEEEEEAVVAPVVGEDADEDWADDEEEV